jgi:hypothetical protein
MAVRIMRGSKRVVQSARDAAFGPSTALLVAAPEVASALGGAVGDSLPCGLPPHLTLVWPFRRSRAVDHRSVQMLAEIFAATVPFSYCFSRLGRFPNVLYLAPEPASRFEDLILRLGRAFPDCPPYGGTFDRIVPHLTVWNGPEPPGLADRVAAALPFTCTADEAWLMMPRSGRGWHTKLRFRFGPTPVTSGSAEHEHGNASVSLATAHGDQGTTGS